MLRSTWKLVRAILLSSLRLLTPPAGEDKCPSLHEVLSISTNKDGFSPVLECQQHEIRIYAEIWVSFNKVSMFGWQAKPQREGGWKERGRTER